uniref:WxxW domain-containing protein n=1 Tax=Callorhinchus milii TaxID=7868 RepID=A0A4W3HNS0_CALMI
LLLILRITVILNLLWFFLCQFKSLQYTFLDSDSSDTSDTSAVCYTEWFDRDNPSGDGDYETVTDIREEYPQQLCKNPLSCEVETIEGIPAELTGFVCVNKQQKGRHCKDYKIRFKCPEDFCKTEPCYTQWFDRDNPSGNGDYETTPEINNEYPDKICKKPISCEVQTTHGTPAELTSDNIDLCTVIGGFSCENKHQNGGKCKDYKIRYKCPEDFCKDGEYIQFLKYHLVSRLWHFLCCQLNFLPEIYFLKYLYFFRHLLYKMV